MIPLLIISNDDKLINNYVNKLKQGSLFSEVIPATREYSIDDIKSLIKETKVFHPKIRVYYFPNFHLSSIPAQNSFLKLLEEPPTNVQFILSTFNKNKLLPTIISRVKIVKLLGNNLQDISGDQLIDPLILGPNFVKFTATDKESAKNIFRQFISFFRNRLDYDKNAPIIIKEILRLNALLESNNLNPQLTVDQLLIFVFKQYRMK